MYTMLTGRPPFDAESSGELIACHLRETPPTISSRVSGLPELLDQIGMTCLAKHPEQRFASVAELADTLLALPSFGWNTEAARRWWIDRTDIEDMAVASPTLTITIDLERRQ